MQQKRRVGSWNAVDGSTSEVVTSRGSIPAQGGLPTTASEDMEIEEPWLDKENEDAGTSSQDILVEDPFHTSSRISLKPCEIVDGLQGGEEIAGSMA